MDTITLPGHPFLRDELPRLGISDFDLRRMLDAHVVRRVLHGVYVDSRLPDSLEIRARAAALVVSPHAVLCDRSAAWLLGVDVLAYREHEVIPRLELFVLRGHRRIERPEVRGGQRDLAPNDVMDMFGVRVTTPLRTALDLGCRLPRYQAIAALDGLMRKYAFTPRELDRELRRYRRRRGVVQLRQLIPAADPRAESPRESWTRLAIHDSRLPAPEPQHWVVEHGIEVFRLDLAYPKSKIAIEYDGVEFHDMTDEQRDRDRRRRAWLKERGWTVIVVTKEGFTDEGREIWLRDLRLALRL